MDKKRASLSAAMLEAMVFVAHNAGMFEITSDELYEKYYDLFSQEFPIDAPEENDDNNEDDEDEDAADAAAAAECS